MIRFQPASDDSLIVYFGESIAPEAHQAVLKLLCSLESQPIPGVRNLHPAYASLLVKFDALKLTHAEMQVALENYLKGMDAVRLPEPRIVEIPVCYGGDLGSDLAELGSLHGLSPEQVIEAHASVTYTVAFLGFVPGFAYLAGLPQNLATPRLSVPRGTVPAGSVGIAGSQTGVYPISTPGGWRIIGRTPLEMFRTDRPQMSLLTIGDRVRFIPISLEKFKELHSVNLRRAAQVPGKGSLGRKLSTIEVQSPGLLTTVQNLGRYGFGPLGISPSGAADAISLRVGNRLVGNPENTAALELTLVGGAFHFPERAVIALSGSDFGATVEDEPIEMWQSAEIQPGQTVHLRATLSGARCYLCVQGGIDVESLLGSASTHVLSGLGGFKGRPLRSGDVLQIGPSSGDFRKRRVSPELLQRLSPRKTLRVTPGPQADWFSESTLTKFYSSTYRVSEESNRMGLRLIGQPVALSTRREMITEGVSVGAVQIPASGQPIILFVEQQTTGGYPKIANVISDDCHSLGQLRPRDEICFEQVDFETARALLIAQENLITSDKLIVE